MHKLRMLAMLGAAVGCGAETVDDVPESTPRVESYKHGSYYETAFVKTGDLEWATGAVLVPFLDGNGNQKQTAGHKIRGTCGVTFVTPKHAITAAHCVDGVDVPDPENQTLWVEMYNVSASFAWQSYDALNGTFPGFTSPMTSIGSGQGYNVEAFPCELVARCGTDWGPLVDCNEPDADIALLRCDGDPGDKYGYVDVPEQDAAVNETAIMPWKHEIYDADPDNQEHFDHYIDYGPATQNFHYFEEGNLLPLRAIGQWYGDLFITPKIMGTWSAYPTVRWTSLMGCHGTSGSGVGRYNAATGHEELLGPVALGDQMDGLLCHPEDADIFEEAMGYTKRQYTYDLTRRAECGEFEGSILLWLWCHRGRFYEEEMKFPDFGFDWPMQEGPPIDRWRVTNEPAAEYPVGSPRLDIPFGTLARGVRARISVHAVGLEGELDAPVELWFGDEQLAVVEPDGAHSHKLTAAIVGDGRSQVSVRYEGELPLGLTELTMARPGEVNGFDTMAQRAGIGMLDEEGLLAPMRFVFAGEEEGFAASLEPGETMAITRQSFVEGAEGWTVRMSYAGETEGLELHAYDAYDEEPIPLEAVVEGGRVYAQLTGAQLPVAVTVTALEGGTVLLDDLVVEAW